MEEIQALSLKAKVIKCMTVFTFIMMQVVGFLLVLLKDIVLYLQQKVCMLFVVYIHLSTTLMVEQELQEI